MNIRKAGIRTQIILCGILAWLFFINAGILIWMSGKMRKKELKIIGVAGMIIPLIAAMISGISGEKWDTAMEVVAMITAYLPTIFILINLKDLRCCLTLQMYIKKNNINMQRLTEDAFEDVKIYPDEITLKNAERLFENRCEAVLKAIQYNEGMSRYNAEKKKQDELAKKQEEKEKQEREKQRIELEKQEIERKRIELEKAKIEAERVKVETERAKADAERTRAEAEKTKAQVEARKLEKENESNKEKITKENSSEIQSIYKGKTVDVNYASEEELAMIPGIGIIIAKKAIAIRNQQGKFESVEEFIRAVGIRENNIANVKAHLKCDLSEVEITGKRHGRRIDF